MLTATVLTAGGGPMLIADPWASWGLVGSMLTAAAVGIWHVVKAVAGNRRAGRAAGALLGLDEDKKDRGGIGSDTLTKALLDYVNHQETDRQADRKERTRQWERIEDTVQAIREQAQRTHELAVGLQALSTDFRRSHEETARTLARLETNQNEIGRQVFQMGATRYPLAPPPPQSHAYPPGKARN